MCPPRGKVEQVEAQLALNSGPAPIWGPRGPQNGVARWCRLNWEIYSQNDYFSLVYDIVHQFLGTDAKNYKFDMFCPQCHLSVAPDDTNIRQRNASQIHTCNFFTLQFCLYMYLHLGAPGRHLYPLTKTSKILNSHVNFWEKLSKAFTARPQKHKAKMAPRANFSRWLPDPTCADARHETHWRISLFKKKY